MISHEVVIDGEMFDFIMAQLGEKYPEKSLADFCVNFRVYSNVIAQDIGLIFDEAE